MPLRRRENAISLGGASVAESQLSVAPDRGIESAQRLGHDEEAEDQ
jgi:hypothetical protein